MSYPPTANRQALVADYGEARAKKILRAASPFSSLVPPDDSSPHAFQRSRTGRAPSLLLLVGK